MSVGAWQQALAIDPVEQQRQGRRRPVLAQAPGQGPGAEQEQARLAIEVGGGGQVFRGLQSHLVLRPLLRQGIAKGLQRWPLLGADQQDVAGLGRQREEAGQPEQQGGEEGAGARP